MTIEKTLDMLNKKGISAVIILKANEGYSVVPIQKTEYSDSFLLRKHFNGKTVLEALENYGELIL